VFLQGGWVLPRVRVDLVLFQHRVTGTPDMLGTVFASLLAAATTALFQYLGETLTGSQRWRPIDYLKLFVASAAATLIVLTLLGCSPVAAAGGRPACAMEPDF